MVARRPRRTLATWCDYEGKRVRLRKDTWDCKIVRDHPELDGHLDWVQQTVEAPDRVCQDKDYALRKCFYKGNLTGHPRMLWVKVVVEYRRRAWWRLWQRRELAEVVTAYGCGNFKKGEQQLWP